MAGPRLAQGAAATAAPAAAPTPTSASTQPSTPAAAPAPDAPRVTIALGGDVQYGRYRSGKLSRHCKDAPFAAVAAWLRGADLALVNLENPLTDVDADPIPQKPWSYRLRAPSIVAPGLRDAGIDAVSVANNHSNDVSKRGMRDTVSNLRRVGVVPLGIAFKGAPSGPVALTAGNVKLFAFASTTFLNLSLKPGSPVALLSNQQVETELAARIEALRRAEPDALILVSLHWGVEAESSPRDHHIRVARRLVDAGANIIMGHHSHIFWPVEVRGSGVIFYSLGNLLFDMPEPETRRTALAEVAFTRTAAGWAPGLLTLHALWRDVSRDGPDAEGPQPAPEAEAKLLFDRIVPESRDKHGTAFVVDGLTARWQRPAADTE